MCKQTFSGHESDINAITVSTSAQATPQHVPPQSILSHPYLILILMLSQSCLIALRHVICILLIICFFYIFDLIQNEPITYQPSISVHTFTVMHKPCSFVTL